MIPNILQRGKRRFTHAHPAKATFGNLPVWGPN